MYRTFWVIDASNGCISSFRNTVIKSNILPTIETVYLLRHIAKRLSKRIEFTELHRGALRYVSFHVTRSKKSQIKI